MSPNRGGVDPLSAIKVFAQIASLCEGLNEIFIKHWKKYTYTSPIRAEGGVGGQILGDLSPIRAEGGGGVRY